MVRRVTSHMLEHARTFSYLNMVPSCDGRTDGRADGRLAPVADMRQA